MKVQEDHYFGFIPREGADLSAKLYIVDLLKTGHHSAQHTPFFRLASGPVEQMSFLIGICCNPCNLSVFLVFPSHPAQFPRCNLL